MVCYSKNTEGPSIGGEGLVAISRPQPYCYKGSGTMVLRPITGIQNLEFELSISVLPRDINFGLPQTCSKKLDLSVDRGAVCLVRGGGGDTADGAFRGTPSDQKLVWIKLFNTFKLSNFVISSIKLFNQVKKIFIFRTKVHFLKNPKLRLSLLYALQSFKISSFRFYKKGMAV
ncbi:MAG: hypothetical protein KBD31_04530 [Proteobacteria bacterium]|nr:hypothetical protein [Pseudomonadota bacterium]